MKRSDISDFEILTFIKENNPWKTPDEGLRNKYPIKVIMAKMKQLNNKGFIQYGISLKTAWITYEGACHLENLEWEKEDLYESLY